MVFLDFAKLFTLVTIILVVLIVVWVLISPLVVGWIALIYVLFRAAPSIKRDFLRAYRRFFPVRHWSI